MSEVRQREPRLELPKVRKYARGQDCTLNSRVCNRDPWTTVWCHSNHEMHGKGVGLKSHDIFGFFGCSACHHWFDITARTEICETERLQMFMKANAKSLYILIRDGVLK